MKQKIIQIENESQDILVATHNIHYFAQLIQDGMDKYFGGRIGNEANIIASLKILNKEIQSLISIESKHEKTIMDAKYFIN